MILSMNDLKPETKDKILTKFALAVPNAQSMTLDYGRDQLCVYFDGIHSREFKISDILAGALKQINRSLESYL